MAGPPLSKQAMARRIALDIPDGSFVNLGIGIPAFVADCLPPGREIVLHSENGILGCGPAAGDDESDLELVNASKMLITLVPGAAIVDHSVSFAVIRGGHLDIAVLGGLQVSAAGDIANWRVPGESVPGVGGAMDLCAGARHLWVTMTHTTRDGEPKIVEQCTYPLTARGRVSRVYTDLAVIDVAPGRLSLTEIVDGWTVDEVQKLTGVPLGVEAPVRHIGPDGIPKDEQATRQPAGPRAARGVRP